VLWSSELRHCSPNGMRGVLDKVVDEGVSFHWFRRTCRHRSRGTRISDVRDRVMGWAADGLYQRNYDRLTIDDLREGVERLYLRDTQGARLSAARMQLEEVAA
jgi:hypothetical protein